MISSRTKHISDQIFSTHLILLILFIVIISYITYCLAMQALINKTYEYNTENLHQINNQTDNFFESIEKRLEYISSFHDMRRFLVFNNQFPNRNNIVLEQKTWNNINPFFNMEPDLEYCLFNLYYPIKINDNKSINPNFLITKENWYQTLQSQNISKKIIYHNPQNYYKNGNNVMSYFIKIQNFVHQNTVGFIGVDIKPTVIDNLYKNKISSTSPILVFNAEQELVYASDQVQHLQNFIIDQYPSILNKKIIHINYENYLICLDTSEYTNWTVISLFSLQELLKPLNQVAVILLLLIMLGLFIEILISYIFSKRITKPIDNLIHSMEIAESGDFRYKDISKSNIYEIKHLSYSFEKMMKKINQLIDTNQKINVLKNEIELSALQQKINPHFLFNTLEIISSQAILEGAKDASKMCQKLGNLFRYNLQEDDIITLKKEMKYIEDYMYLQLIRFDDKLNVFYDIDENILKYKIPKLTLQPLIENSIRHGFKDHCNESVISITAHKRTNYIQLEIKDNGKGISPEKLQEIIESMNNDICNFHHFIDRKKHIGLRNANARIALAFGPPYGLHISSQLTKGTCITITIPALQD